MNKTIAMKTQPSNISKCHDTLTQWMDKEPGRNDMEETRSDTLKPFMSWLAYPNTQTKISHHISVDWRQINREGLLRIK